MPVFDPTAIRRAFGAAHASYAGAAALQRACEDELLDRLDFLKRPPAVVLDLGSGPGRGAGLLARRFPKARVVALDLALPMLQAARREFGWRRRFDRVNADIQALPIAGQSVDLVCSSLCLQWCEDLPRVFAEIRRVLKPGGLLLCSTFGPQTLDELRSAWAAVDDEPHVHGFPDLQVLGSLLLQAGFRDPVLERDLLRRHYPDARALMRELQALGAGNADRRRRRGLYGRSALQAMEQAYERLRQPAGLPASWEIHYLMAFGPEQGQPIRQGGMDVASFPLEHLRRRRS